MSMVMGFDGITGYVDCGNGASLNLTTTISVECMVNSKMFGPSVPGGAVGMLGKWLANDGWMLGWYSARAFYFFVKDAICIETTGYTTYPVGWIHLVATYTGGAGTGKIYVNGVDKTVGSSARALTNPASNLGVGCARCPPSVALQLLRGIIAYARVYNRVLSLTEIQYNIEHPNNPKRRGLVLNLTQESLFGGQWKDLSGNANHGTLVGGAAPVPSNNLAGRNVSL